MHHYVLFKLLVNTKRPSIVEDLWEDNKKVCNAHEMQGINFAISKKGYG